MTDDLSDVVPGWPPLAALFAAALLILPPSCLTMVALAYERRPSVLVVVLPWLLLTVPGVYGLLRGRPRGYGYAVGTVLLLGSICGGVAALCIAQGLLMSLTALVLPTFWLSMTACLLWWPATRRWCGRLPADPYGEADD